MTKFDFKQYVEDNMEFQRSGETLHINCVDPDCDDNWKLGHHLYVYPEGRKPHCYKCGKNFSPVEFIMHVEECSLTTAMRRVIENTPRVKRPEFPLDKIMKDYLDGRQVTDSVQEDKVELPFSVPIEEGSEPWDYLYGRGFGREIIDHFGLSFCPPFSGSLSSRILVPVYFCGKLVGYQGRAIRKGQEPKYLFPNGTGGSAYLYGWDEAVESARSSLPDGSRFIILVEGITDMWRCWLYGYKNTVATFGKVLKAGQRKILLSYPDIDGVFIFWDGNATDDIEKAADDLQQYKKVYVVNLPDKAEPDLVTNLEMEKLIGGATYWNSLSSLDKMQRRLGRFGSKAA